MTIYTPMGMPIKLSVEYAFTLLGRLYPKIKPHIVLKTAEGINSTHEAISLLAGLICFFFELKLLYIGTIIIIIDTLIKAMHIRSKYCFPLVKVGIIYCYGSFGIINIIILTTVWFMASWQGVITVIIARVLTNIINSIQEFGERKNVNFKFTEFERAFVDSYRYYASQLGKTTDLDITEEDKQLVNWKLVYMNYINKYPELKAFNMGKELFEKENQSSK
jgi:hypothetical protein